MEITLDGWLKACMFYSKLVQISVWTEELNEKSWLAQSHSVRMRCEMSNKSETENILIRSLFHDGIVYHFQLFFMWKSSILANENNFV